MRESEGKSDLAGATIRSFLWSLAARYGAKGVTLLSIVVLARLLDKEDFGVAGYALMVIGLLDSLRDMGLGAALIYHRDDPKAPVTVFWMQMALGLVLCALTWFGAPLLGAYFNDPRAVPATRALAFTLPLTALGSVHASLLRKNLKFKRKFLPDMTRALSKAAVAIPLAFLGYGAWSLVFGQIGAAVTSVVVLWLVCDWRPALAFSRRMARSLFAYGSSIVGLQLVSTVIGSLDLLIIGRFLGPSALGVYTVAGRLPGMAITQVCRGISQVLFPFYSRLRDDVEKLSESFIQATRYLSLVTVPLGVGLALVAEPLVESFFGSKWNEAAPVLRALAFLCVLFSFSYNAGDVYKAQGRPDLQMRVAVMRLAFLAPVLWWVAEAGITLVDLVWTRIAVAVVFTLVEAVVAARLLSTPLTKIVAAPLPALVASAGMSAVVLAVLAATEGLAAPLRLLLAVLAGASAYPGMLYLVARDDVETARERLRKAIRRR